MNPSLVVQRLDRTSTLVSSTGLPIKCVVFPDTGGVQFIDATGAVVTMATTTGAALLAATQTFTGRNTFAPLAASGAVAPAVTVTGSADTLLTAEAPIVSFNLSAARTLAAGVDPAQRAVVITAPVYNGPGTIASAVTVSIAGPPTGTAVTGEAISLAVESGQTQLNGDLYVDTQISCNDGLLINGSVTNPTITVTRTDEGVTLGANGSGTVTLSAGATGSVRVGSDAATKLGFCEKAPITRPSRSLATVTAAELLQSLADLGLLTATA